MEQKERILAKSHELFYRYGIRSVSMDDIAAQLGMSKKTVYQFYKEKDELVDAVFTTVMEANKKQCLLCNEKGKNSIHEIMISFEMLKDMLADMHPSVLFDLKKYHPKSFKKFEDFRDQFLYKIIKQNIENGIEQGLYREDIDSDIISRYRLYSIMLSFDTEVFPTNKTQLLYIEQQLLEHFLYGLANAKGQKLIQKYKNQRISK